MTNISPVQRQERHVVFDRASQCPRFTFSSVAIVGAQTNGFLLPLNELSGLGAG